MALAEGRVKAQDMADHLGVSRQTLTRWMHDNGTPPRRAYIAQWALATGVPVEWLEHGIAPTTGDDGGGAPANTDEYLPQITGTAHVMPLRRVA